MKVKEFVLIVSALLIVGGFGFYAYTHTNPPVPVTWRTETIKEESGTPPYTITVDHPVFAGAGTKTTETAVNAAILAEVRSSIEGFKNEVKDIVIYPEEPGQQSEMKTEYEIATATSSLLSVRFSTYTYAAGAAHPNGFMTSFNYDLKRNRALALGDLFLPNSNYLQTISGFANAALLEKFSEDREGAEDWVRSGTAAIPENYQVVLITNEGLRVVFNPYQVGPYAIGPQEIVVPYVTVKDMIDPQGPLNIFSIAQ